MQRSCTFCRFYYDYVSGRFLPNHKVQDLFLCLEGMLVHVCQCNQCMNLLGHLFIEGNRMSILKHVNVVNLSLEIRYGVQSTLSFQLGWHLKAKLP